MSAGVLVYESREAGAVWQHIHRQLLDDLAWTTPIDGAECIRASKERVMKTNEQLQREVLDELACEPSIDEGRLASQCMMASLP
jgi:hypothetical protein